MPRGVVERDVLQVCEPGRTALLIVAAGRLEIGRGGSGLLLADPQISRRHLVVESGGDGVVVRDAGSTNGTTVDGVRVRLPVLLGVGQVLRFGRCTLELVAWPPPARDVRGRHPGAAS